MSDASLWPSGRLYRGSERYRIAHRLRRLYDEGETVLDLATRTGYSAPKIRYLLSEAGTTMRTRGGKPPR